MTQLKIDGVNTYKLHDELIASGIVPLLVERLEEKTYITFADNTDMAVVQTVIDAHNPTPYLAPPTAEERLAAVEEALLMLI